jgi:hypothetical protein
MEHHAVPRLHTFEQVLSGETVGALLNLNRPSPVGRILGGTSQLSRSVRMSADILTAVQTVREWTTRFRSVLNQTDFVRRS